MTDPQDSGAERARLERHLERTMIDYQEMYGSLLRALRDVADWRKDRQLYPESEEVEARGKRLVAELRRIQTEARRLYVKMLRAKADMVEHLFQLDTPDVPDFLPEDL